jgi:hypothetical protein
MVGRDRAVGIANALQAGRSGDRIPVAARFYGPVQIWYEAIPSLLHKGYRVFPRDKTAGTWR